MHSPIQFLHLLSQDAPQVTNTARTVMNVALEFAIHNMNMVFVAPRYEMVGGTGGW